MEEQEDEDSLAISNDDLIKSGQIEGVASSDLAFAGPSKGPDRKCRTDHVETRTPVVGTDEFASVLATFTEYAPKALEGWNSPAESGVYPRGIAIGLRQCRRGV